MSVEEGLGTEDMGWALAFSLHEVDPITFAVYSVVEEEDFKEHLEIAVHYRTWDYSRVEEGYTPNVSDKVLPTHTCTQDDFLN